MDINTRSRRLRYENNNTCSRRLQLTKTPLEREIYYPLAENTMAATQITKNVQTGHGGDVMESPNSLSPFKRERGRDITKKMRYKKIY